MYEKRWHHVLQIGKKVLEVYSLLKACWKRRTYLEGHSGADGNDLVADDDFSAGAVTKCLADPLFLAYLKMVVEVDKVAEGIGSWSEGCPCHEAILAKISSPHKRRKVISKLCGTTGQNRAGGDGCRLAGKRAWEMALGKVQDVISESSSRGLRSLMREVRTSLTEAQWAIVAEDYAIAQTVISADFSQKLHFGISYNGFYAPSQLRTHKCLDRQQLRQCINSTHAVMWARVLIIVQR